MNKFIFLIQEIAGGKTIYRSFFNYYFWKHCRNATDRVIDLASGKQPSYYKYLDNNLKLIRADNNPESKPDVIVDLNNKLPFQDSEFENVFLFNIIYILENPEKTFEECFRILKNSGSFYLSSPFIFNEAREPHDYQRFTSEGLTRLLIKAGFSNYKIIPMGERFTAALSLIHKFIFFRIFQLPFFALAFFMDGLVTKNIKTNHPCPLGYFCVAKK